MSACRASQISIVIAIIAIAAHSAHAIGWDSDDFLIGGGPSFTTKIGVFDHDLTFKGLLDSNFATVAGMDFDAAGHLVAVAGALRTVRVYDFSGAIVGGFTRSDDLLGTPGDLKVTPNGDYVIATQNFGGGDGARQFSSTGTFVRQYGSGDITGAAVIPGNRVWIGGIGSSVIRVFDLTTGVQIDTFSVTGMSSCFSIRYSPITNTILSISQGKVWELDINGNLLRMFTASGLGGLNSITRGPDGDVFATDSSQALFRWHADGTFVGSTSTSGTLGFPAGIVWAGSVPEPGMGLSLTVAAMALCGGRSRRRSIFRG